MKLFYLIILAFTLTACFKGQTVDLIIHNAKIHTMDEENSVVEAIAIKDGKIVELGPERQILNKYHADEYVDAAGKDVFPGLADAHTHMMSLARQKLSINLVGTASMEDLLVRVEKYDQRGKYSTLIGRGWDQSLWANKTLPTNELLNQRFPNKPVVLYRIDGHAVLVNDAALRKFGVTESLQIEGGAFLKDSAGKLTGVVLDNAITYITDQIPDFSEKGLEKALIEIQQELFAYGVTDVHEAGLSYSDFRLIDRLVTQKKMTIGIYGMLFPSKENAAFAKKNGIYKNKNLLVRSFKVVGDGALGSRGAYLKDVYSDDPHNHGLLTTSKKEMQRIAALAELTGYQMNIHAIGDSTNRIVLDIIGAFSEKNMDHRWRIEHAQIIDVNDFSLLKSSGAFPSVQPTHAVSDCFWVEQRVGAARMQGAYAYKSLLENSQMGMITLGTDFPVEQLNPFLTIHAAINRTNMENAPMEGFQMNEAIDLQSCMKGMTIWAAFASFQEQSKGSLEQGKEANLVILQNPFIPQGTFKPNYANLTLIKGKKVFDSN